MPKTSKVELDFQKERVSQYLLERPHSKKVLEICNRLVNSLLKAKSSARRKEYRQRLDKILVCLAVESGDLIEWKEKKKALQEKYSNLQTRYSQRFQEYVKDSYHDSN